MKLTYTYTVRSCFAGYIVQAIINNFAPLLFLTFQNEFSLSIAQVTSLVTINFAVQLLTDLAAAAVIDKIGYRAGMVTAHAMAALGFPAMAFLPSLLPVPYVGILIGITLNAIGGGLLEVLVSPVVEACPTDHKEKTMSLLHSFYCWGHMAVVLISTLYFALFGAEHWRILALLWTIVPIANGLLFCKLPIAPLLAEDETSMPIKELLKNKLFWVLLLLMVCAGASEQGVSQWASAFAEQGLGVSKTIGDLMGPMLFAATMGTARFLYGKFGEKINLQTFMACSAVLCIIAYLLTALSPIPVLALLGCGICGFSVGILWPGTFSLSAAVLRKGGTAMFALLALAGDIGCASGPTVVGLVAEQCGGSLSAGILCGIIFPIFLLIGLMLYRGCSRQRKNT